MKQAATGLDPKSRISCWSSPGQQSHEHLHGTWAPTLSVPQFSAPVTHREEQKLLVAAQAAPPMGDGLVEGDFKTTEVVQRPNTF